MKRILCTYTAMMLAFAVHASAGTAPTTEPERHLSFQRDDGSYFERNDTALTARTSFLVVTSQAQFDKIFGAAPIMGRNHFLPGNIFKTKVIIATIARGHFLRTYNSPKVTAKDGKIYVFYKATDTQQESASFASPLILAVAKGQYSEVIFVENGKDVGSATFPRTSESQLR